MDFREWLSIDERFTALGKEFRDEDVPVALQHILDSHPSPENLIVTFTEVDKVGVNPKSVFSTTPNGIYFYPLKYVLGNNISEVEFAGDRPFIKVCELARPGRVLRMRTGGDEGIGLLYDSLPRAEVDEAARILEFPDPNLTRSNYSALWKVARRVAHNRVLGMDFPDRPERGATPLMGSPRPNRSQRSTAEVIEWNAVFRQAGIDGFIDEGTGTIYSYEPTQGVVFSAGAIRVLHSIENPHSMQSGVRYDKRGMPFMPYKETDPRAFKGKNLDRLRFSKMAKGPRAAENIKSWIRSRKRLDICGMLYALDPRFWPSSAGRDDYEPVLSQEEVIRAVMERGWPMSDEELRGLMSCGMVKDQAAVMRTLGKENVRRFMATPNARDILKTPEARAVAELQPVLDAALADLTEADRDAADEATA